VFVSYSHRHAREVQILCDVISAATPVFIDKRALEFGSDWRKAIRKGIRTSSVFYLFWCDHAAESDEVRHELAMALQYRVPIRPVMMSETKLPSEVAHLHAVTSTNRMCAQSLDRADAIIKEQNLPMFSTNDIDFYIRQTKYQNNFVLDRIGWAELPDQLARDISCQLEVARSKS
jgi:hypothetical protein